MIDTVYIEREAAEHPRAIEILARFPDAERIVCQRYGEVFNRRAQSYRLQKRRQALILARKTERGVLEIPAGYGMGGERNFFFSHLLNCVFDCRYCYLRGMHRSAHLLLFVNYEQLAGEIERRAAEAPDRQCHFFSGFGGDSLAWDEVTGFCDYFLPVFEALPNAWLELRTKSDRIRGLLRRQPSPRAVVAFSLAPQALAAALEQGAPRLDRRLQAMSRLAELGWKIGLRFDPLIFYPDYQRGYAELFERVFSGLRPQQVHSASLGALRFPKQVFANIIDLYPDERLLAGPLVAEGRLVTYRQPIREQMLGFCRHRLQGWLPAERIFECGCEPVS